MPQDFNAAARIAYLSALKDETNAEEVWVRTLRDYADGDQTVYLTDRQKEFIGLNSKKADYLFQHNLCGLAIATVVERLEVASFAPVGDAAEALALKAGEWWERNRMDAEQDELYEAACRDGVGYIILDRGTGDGPVWAVNERYDGKQGVKIHYDASTNESAFASKKWQTYDPVDVKQTGRTRVTLYFPDRVEKYINWQKGQLYHDAEGHVLEDDGDEELQKQGWSMVRDSVDEPWPIPWTDKVGKPLGLAVIPFKNPGGSEIGDLISLQDLLNKSDLDLIAGADASGFRILWASGVATVYDSDGNPTDTDISPGRIIKFDDAASHLGAVEPADLTRMIATCKYWVESVAAISRTPHYLLSATGADQPSGESLRWQETGLVNKCARKHKVFGNAWENVIYLSAKLDALTTGEQAPTERLQAEWKAVATEDEARKWEIAAAKQGAGIPAEQTWAEAGYSAEEIEQIKKLRAEEDAGKMATYGAMMAEAERKRIEAERRASQGAVA